MKTLIKILLTIIIFLVLVFGLIFGFIRLKVYLINKDAKNIVEEFQKTVEENKKNDEKINDEKQDEEELTKKINIFYKEYQVIGTIEIPKLSLSYPIISEMTDESMKKGIIVLYGAGLNNIGNTVLSGHSYIKGTYFSNINELAGNDSIIITDIYGNKITYYVYNNFITDANDSSFYDRDTNNLREITLTTCTLKGNKRHIILAKEKKEN